MGNLKWKPCYDGSRKYKESMFLWLKKGGEDKQPYCCSIIEQKSSLCDHVKTIKHKSKVSPLCQHQLLMIRVSTVYVKTKKTELQMAVAVACHCTILAVDHIGEISTNDGKQNQMNRINVIAPALKEELIKDGGFFFSNSGLVDGYFHTKTFVYINSFIKCIGFASTGASTMV